MKNPFKKRIEEVAPTPEQYVVSNAKEALDKLSEVAKGNFKIDIKPFPGIKTEGNNFLIIKENDIWFLRIC